jgi:DNA polymerase
MTNIRVEPDGPIPCDLAVVGQDPGKEEEEQGRGFVGRAGQILWGGEYDLIGGLLGRHRDTVYVSNVCKQRITDQEWERLSGYQRAYYYEALRAELGDVQPKVVLAFGRRACEALVPSFRSISRENGKARWGYNEDYIVVPLWHPAAFLRGNKDVITDLAVAISSVPILLSDGLPKPLRHGPPLPWKTSDDFLGVWPELISFLLPARDKKSGEPWERKAKCTLCGQKLTCRKYVGEGVKWILCQKHAIITEEWARTNEEAMKQHSDIATPSEKLAKIRRAVERMEKVARNKWEEREHYER